MGFVDVNVRRPVEMGIRPFDRAKGCRVAARLYGVHRDRGRMERSGTSDHCAVAIADKIAASVFVNRAAAIVRHEHPAVLCIQSDSVCVAKSRLIPPKDSNGLGISFGSLVVNDDHWWVLDR